MINTFPLLAGETGTYATGSPATVTLSGSPVSGPYRTFSAASSDAQNTFDNGSPCTVLIRKVGTNTWLEASCTWNSSTNVFSVASSRQSNGSLGNGDSVEVYAVGDVPPVTLREQLTAARTYYVATTGSNSNNGLTAGAPFLTIQKAVDTVSFLTDPGTNTVTISVANGTYTENVVLRKHLLATVTIDGGSTSTIISPSSGTVFDNNGAGCWSLKNMKVVSSGTWGVCLFASAFGKIEFSAMDFGAAAASHIRAAYQGYAKATGNYTVSGAAPVHWDTFDEGRIHVTSRTITFTTNPTNFSTCFASSVVFPSIYCASNTFTNSAYVTGKRYNADEEGRIMTWGGGANYLPGNSAGTIANGGVYR